MNNTFYYGIDVQIDNYIGCGKYQDTVYRTLNIVELVKVGTKETVLRDSFTEDYFIENKESLIKEAIKVYNSQHKVKVSQIVGIRKTPIIE